MSDAYLKLNAKKRRQLLDKAIAIHGWRCCICGLAIHQGQETLQHIKPRSKGGDESLDNLAPAHARCNYALGDREMVGPSGERHDGTAFFLT